MEESKLHDLIKNDKLIQKRMLDILKIKDDGIVFISEDQYPNGMYADFSILQGKKVKAIVELKGSDIGVNDYVRGTGQLFQYQHFINSKLTIKDYDYSDAKTVFCFPSSLLLDKKYNIGLFAYPPEAIILEFNESSKTFRIIDDKQLKIFAGARGKDVLTVSSIYIRDTRLFEIYIALRFFQIKKLVGESKIERKKAEEFLKKLGVPDNNNWRNAFISLSSLGLIDSNNISTDLGSQYSSLSFEEFAFEIYDAHIGKYFDIILEAITELSKDGKEISNNDIKECIYKTYGNRDVLFITDDTQSRYISSWLNIMRDDYDCIYFPPKKEKKIFTIKYKIGECNKKTILKKIQENSSINRPYDYIEKFNTIIKDKIDK